MKGLLLKEIFVMFKNNKLSIIIIPIFTLFGIFNKQFMFVMLIPVLLSMLTLGNMTYDELSRWNSFAQCMPLERKSIVSYGFDRLSCCKCSTLYPVNDIQYS